MPKSLRSMAVTLGALALAALAARPAGAQWIDLPASAGAAPSAVAFRWLGADRVFVATVTPAGDVGVKVFDPSWGEDPFSSFSLPSPPEVLDPATPPVLARERASVKGRTERLHLFVRTRSNRLYQTFMPADRSEWLGWQRVWLDRVVTGPFSVVVTSGAASATVSGGGSAQLHLAFQSRVYQPLVGMARSVEYRLVDSGGVPVAGRSYPFAVDGQLGWDGRGTVGLAVRGSSSVTLETLRREADTVVWTWQSSGRVVAQGGAVADVSSLVHHAGAFHFACALRESRAGEFGPVTFEELRHVRFRADGTPGWSGHSVYGPRPGASAARAALAVYRGRLFTAFRDADGVVRTARWDTASPSLPWIGGEAVGGSFRTASRLALAPLDVRARIRDLGWYADGWGNDLVAVARDAGSSAVRAANVSRERARVEVGRQMGLFNAHIAILSGCFETSPWSVDLSLENRPVLSELGADLAALPHWLGGFLFKRQAEEESCPSDYFAPPCSEAKQPVVLQCADKSIFVDVGNSMWLAVDNDDQRIFEELGHTLASAIGLRDDGHGGAPSSVDAARSRIPLEELTRGYALFGEPSARCPVVPGRCLGFTDYDYEVHGSPSRQHHFLYAVLSYAWRGDDFRTWVALDASGANPLGETHWTEREMLRRKYDWIRKNIYRGMEFGNGGAPIALP